MKRAVAIAGVALLVLAASTNSNAQRQTAAVPDVDWTVHGATRHESGYTELASINAQNVGKLALEWSLDLPGEATLEATPLEANGVLYFTGSYAAVYAVDVATGKLLWKYDPETWKHNPGKMPYSFAVNRGAAYENGRVFVAALDGRLIALDAKSGAPLWTADTIPPNYLNISTGAPRTFNGKVIIGNGGADFGARGFVTAYDAATGKQLWRFFTVPGTPQENKGDPVMERAAATWSGEYWKTGTGGTVWNGMTFDPEFNRIYIGTGNGGPYDVNTRSPGDGDNLYLASIVALDADTGKYAWHYQVNPREAWDFKCTPNMIAATLSIEGKPRKVLMQAPSNGFFYVLDRDTGKLISAEKLGKVNWAKAIDLATGRPIEYPNIRHESGDQVTFPSGIGAHNWQDMSFNPNTGLVYVPYMQLGMRFRKGFHETPEGSTVMGLTVSPVKEDDDDAKGALIAWDPVQQKPRWRVQHETLWNGGTLTTAGNLVFQGTADGYLSSYNAATGQRLWRYYAGLGIVAPPVSYSRGGKQYVSILVGYGGVTSVFGKYMHVGWKWGKHQRRLLTFALDGKATSPAFYPPDFAVRAVDDPSIQIDEADVEAGRPQFNYVCGGCHGINLLAVGAPGPDLRESTIAMNLQSLTSVVHDGVLQSRGMPRYEMFTPAQIRQLHAFIRAKTRETLGTRKPSSIPDDAAGHL